MEIKKDAKIVTIEPAENGLIVQVNSSRDPYSSGEIGQRMVFSSMGELFKFLTDTYAARKDFTVDDLRTDMNDDKAVGRTPKLDLYDIEDEVFGGGS